MQDKKAPNPALLAVAAVLAFIGASLALWGLYNWYMSFGVHGRFSGVGGSFGQLVASKLQSNYRIKGTLGLLFGLASMAGAGGAAFMGLKGAGSPSSPQPQGQLPQGGPQWQPQGQPQAWQQGPHTDPIAQQVMQANQPPQGPWQG